MEAKQEDLLTLNNLSVLEEYLPHSHKPRNSFTGWTDDEISILKEFPKSKAEFCFKVTKYNSKREKNSKGSLDLLRTNEIRAKSSNREVRIRQNIATLKGNLSPDLSFKRPGEKTIRRLNLTTNYEDKVMSHQRGEKSPGLNITFDLQTTQTRIANISSFREAPNRFLSAKSWEIIDRKAEVLKKLEEFYPKLKPKQGRTKNFDFTTLKQILQGCKPTKMLNKKQNLWDMSKNGDSSQKEDFKVTEEQLVKVEDEDDQSFRNLKRMKGSLIMNPERKKLVQLKSFNNANLKYQRRNFMGLSVLSNDSKTSHLKNIGYIEKTNREMQTPVQIHESLIHHSYPEKIANSNKNIVSLLKNKPQTPYLCFFREQDKDLSEKGFFSNEKISKELRKTGSGRPQNRASQTSQHLNKTLNLSFQYSARQKFL